tara:strand:+ start:1395 stop:1523 length:129 start_codon:yes stop_codon:yes gene_type:complete
LPIYVDAVNATVAEAFPAVAVPIVGAVGSPPPVGVTKNNISC